MAVISNNEIARAIYLASKDKSHAEQSAVLKRIVNFLFKKRLMSKAPDILSKLSRIINQEEGRVAVKVSSVEKLDSKTKTSLEHALKKRYAAREVVFNEKIDPKLIGGIKVEVNNEVIDLSIKNKIEKLQAHLIKSA